MAVSFRVPGKFKLKRNKYTKGYRKNRDQNTDLQEFVFEGVEDSDDEISFTETSLPTELRKRESQNDSIQLTPTHAKSRKQYINYEVKESDSLQSISLRFGCQVAELKQANKMMTDQDFYGHQFIKIPIPEHGVLSEEIIQSCSNLQKNNATDGVINLSIGQMLSDETSLASRSFLEAMDEDIQHIVETTQNCVHLERDELNTPRFHTMAVSVPDGCDGSNWGMNWWCLLGILVIIGVVTPILYVWLYKSSEHS